MRLTSMLCTLLCYLPGLLLGPLLANAVWASEPIEPDPVITPTRIAVASCNRPDRRHDPWPAVLNWQPTHWLWTGDAVYHDSAVPSIMQQHFSALLDHPGYTALRTRVPVSGTWDDHDYGRNDAGRGFPGKQDAQQAWLDFLDVPADNPRRARAGVYHSFDIGIPPNQARVILLDTRFHRDDPSETGDILGADQWTWLETLLRTSSAQAHVIVSSIQIIPDQHTYECWGRFPAARAQLLRLLSDTNPAGLILVSGDRHIGEVTTHTRDGMPTLWEITASGLTEAWRQWPGEPNRGRVGDAMTANHFGGITIDWHENTITLSLVGTGKIAGPESITLNLTTGEQIPPTTKSE